MFYLMLAWTAYSTRKTSIVFDDNNFYDNIVSITKVNQIMFLIFGQ